MDTTWTVEQRRTFVDAISIASGSSRMSGIRYVASNEEALAQAEIVEQILNRVLPGWHSTRATSAYDRWLGHREAAIRAVAKLQRADEIRFRLGDGAPTLSAGGLHPWVWAGAMSLWGSGHYAEAVGAAARQVNAETQTKVSRRDVAEMALLQQCFSDDPPAPGKPRLRLPGDDGGKSASSLRRGVRAYAEGCYAALRNPAAHDVAAAELSEHEALEQLAAFSILARWVDTATLQTAS